MRTNKNPEVNAAILSERMALLNEIEGPRVGDFVRRPDDGYDRIVKVMEDEFQCGTGSFHLFSGFCSFSGTLHYPNPIHVLQATAESRNGAIWFFNEGRAGTDNGVDFEAEFRVFTIKEGFEKDYYLTELS